VIVDTGVLIALVDRNDRHHRAAAAIFTLPEPKILPEPVIVEADWSIETNLGVDVEVAFLRGLDGGQFAIEPTRRADRERAVQLIEQYRDARIGYVDAIVAAIAERLGDPRIATVDRRHFSMIQPRSVDAFELLP
jgi:predicted nucleic acid-binding protein